MKRIATIVLMFICTVAFGLPAKKITLDIEDASQGFETLYVQQGQLWNLDCYIEEDGTAYTESDLANITGKAYYGSSSTSTAFVVVSHDSINTNTGVVSFEFTPSDLNTNGVFEMYVILQDTNGYPLVTGKGRINIEETTVTGNPSALRLLTPLVWSTLSASGNLDFGGGTLSNLTISGYYTSTETDSAIDAEISALTVVTSGDPVNDWYFTAGADAIPRGTTDTQVASTNEDQLVNTITFDPLYTDYKLYPDILRQESPETVTITVPSESASTFTYNSTNQRLTHVTNATVTASVVYASTTRTITNDVTLTYDATGTQAYITNGIASSVRKDATEAIDTLIASNTDTDFYTGYDWEAEPTSVTHNTNCWAYSLRNALSCVSPWASGTRGDEKSGTLISPIHFVNANHFGAYPAGTTIKWVAGDGTIITNTVASSMQIDGSDIQLYRMSSAIDTNQITVAKFLPDAYASYLPTNLEQLPLVFFDKKEAVYVRDGRSTSLSTYSSPILETRIAVAKTPEDGDSGNPILAIIDGDPVLMTTLTTSMSGQDYTAYKTLIEAGMVTLGGGYTTVTDIDLSGFTTTF